MAVPSFPLRVVHIVDNAEASAVIEASESGLGGVAMSEAARRMLKSFFNKMLAHEEGVLASEDVSSIHQMRVATRRLRASFQALEGVFSHKLIQRYRRGLRGVARALGEVRDCDVFLEHIASYTTSLSKERRDALAPLIDAVTSRRARARQRLLKLLKKKEYARFKETLWRFLNTPGKGELPSPEAGITQRVRDFAGSAIWRRYELWRAYETVLQGASDETLHQARLAGKHLRYTIELFADSLGPQVQQLLEPLIALQDCLGSLQDSVTAQASVVEFGLVDDPGTLEYLTARNAEQFELRPKVPWLWEQVASPTYQRRLFKLIVGM